MSDYRVLARKYRPQTFADLIGQDALVRTLTNAVAKNRLAHAFLLTGIRGIGKTTTARIIAKALNCLGPEGNYAAPTASPCGSCANCAAIAGDRHVDVIEMDAASRTGVDDIRDIIETVRYAPVSARFKVYIIDEVHMLSKNAFNALLKTLEEPPPHVKFIFATTELRKIPVTILSRCQRFDLKRVDLAALSRHMSEVCAKESVQAEDEALTLIAGAAEGSVRDALSMLDQAIVHTEEHVATAAVREMLGLTDKSRTFDLLEHLFSGDAARIIPDFRALYEAGADPALLLQDLLEIVHFVSLIKLAPGIERNEVAYAESERLRGRKLADALSVPTLSLAWQMLLKALAEVRQAPHPMLAAEMAFIRIAHAAQLPPPAEIVRALKQQREGGGADAAASSYQSPFPAPAQPSQPVAAFTSGGAAGGGGYAAAREAAPLPAFQPEREERPAMSLQRFEDAVQLFRQRREMVLYSYLTQEARLVEFRRGHIELSLSEQVPAEAAGKIGKLLSDWTGERWMVSLSRSRGGLTLAEQAAAEFARRKEEAAAHPLVARVLELFPGAEIMNVIKEGEDAS